MLKITFIGAGSLQFGKELLTDMCTFPALRDDTIICLEDVNAERLDLMFKYMQKLKESNLDKLEGITFQKTTNQREAIVDAKYVIGAINVGGYNAYKLDLDIPYKYGVSQCIGDTLGPGGVFRFIRNAPVLKSIVEDMAEVGHNAENKGIKPLFMNYSNPMAMNTWYCNTFVPDSTVGLCYGVIDVIMMLSVVMGVKPIELDYLCAGINHMAWFLEFRYKNSNDPNSTWQDAYPLLEEGIKKDDHFAQFDKVRIDLMRAVGGYYMTESTGAISEYTPYFRKRKDLLEEYGKDHPGIESLKHAADYNIQQEEQQKMEKKFMSQLKRSRIPLRESASILYASQIINAMETNVPFRFNGNTMNKEGSLITNLPKGCCVEVPIFADSHGLHPQGGITLPTACQALNMSNIMVQKAAVEGLLELNKEKIYQAVMLDPNTASICSLEEIRDMVDEMFQTQAKWLPKF